MAKGQKNSGREPKKAKGGKKPPTSPASPFARDTAAKPPAAPRPKT